MTIDLRSAARHHRVAEADRHPESTPDVGLHTHDLTQIGECPAFWMVGKDKIEHLAFLPQTVGQQHLTHSYVDANQHPAYARIRIAGEDACVTVGVAEGFPVELPPSSIWEIFEGLLGLRQDTLNPFAPA